MTQHSSGTWIARGNTVFTEGDWACSVAVATNIGSLRKAEMNANARLIAAAPDLLDALLTFPGFTDDATIGDAWIDKMHAALDKAGAITENRYKQVMADRALMVAAPEMFEALRTIVEYGPQSGMKADAPMLIAARAAIAKATGQ